MLLLSKSVPPQSQNNCCLYILAYQRRARVNVVKIQTFGIFSFLLHLIFSAPCRDFLMQSLHSGNPDMQHMETMLEKSHLRRLRMSECYDKDVVSTLWIYLPSLSEFTLRSQRVTVYIALKSIFITFLSVQQMEHLQTPECGSLCRRQLSLNKPEGFVLHGRAQPAPVNVKSKCLSALLPLVSFSLEELITGRGCVFGAKSGTLNQLIPEC